MSYFQGHSMFLSDISENEVIETVNNCKNKKSTDAYDIDMHILKTVVKHVSKPFIHICNISFESSVFPNKMKLAKVVPTFKSGEKNRFTNYRPVSLLPQFSKVLEKLFLKRLISYI